MGIGHTYVTCLVEWERGRKREEHRNRKFGKMPSGWNTEMCQETGIHSRTFSPPNQKPLVLIDNVLFLNMTLSEQYWIHFLHEPYQTILGRQGWSSWSKWFIGQARLRFICKMTHNKQYCAGKVKVYFQHVF